MPKLEEWEIKKYWQIFSGLKPVNNKLSGDKVSVVFKNSRLDQTQLEKVWDLSDIDVDGQLDFEEFCIAMRLIFDLVNGNTSELPKSLPDWLIPGSKQHLVQANRAVAGNSTGFDSDTDEELMLSSDFDWYISPSDKSRYEDIYASSADRFGRITFQSLSELYKTLNGVPETDISFAWNLVNPKQSETIDKDQCLVFLHILSQRSSGKRVPKSVPPSLRATFNRETPSYDVNDYQAEERKKPSSTKQAFGESYLSKITGSSKIPNNKTDFSATDGTDWEEVKLRRELKELEELIQKAEDAKNNKGLDDKLSLAKYEFENLLKYKEQQVAELGTGSDLQSIRANIEVVQSQVSQLESFLEQKRTELGGLQREIEALR
ncbi:hypothetical protein KL918_001558 [Ogataea parapolymorpha]|uniref:Actin cytoskeleton-regulatory complex protein END3 n=1 Tax=Ogataea parapolymorpha (strain ATCC 26012 / BCRC 20466 / JCM 22074 / NRRL Y-7560 / DL-1) TaxID=871575 RepID=W1QGP4_OGAPD|nr:Actin cytoskeleton-regulatory complex protein END3 [Ogataea parapolymorpha DL-1]ESW99505.1 Actin cytoskeleton-regulatory complex protein END3 [Ogataea parapolymorpha DL-1]KAG7868915.1 hypothetical protein KL918_001558 [Ogataea parapolymorpha]KAG7873996.1 hypothetical protein KL916_001770 [Ogataea parapolymorpha]